MAGMDAARGATRIAGCLGPSPSCLAAQAGDVAKHLILNGRFQIAMPGHLGCNSSTSARGRGSTVQCSPPVAPLFSRRASRTGHTSLAVAQPLWCDLTSRWRQGPRVASRFQETGMEGGQGGTPTSVCASRMHACMHVPLQSQPHRRGITPHHRGDGDDQQTAWQTALGERRRPLGAVETWRRPPWTNRRWTWRVLDRGARFDIRLSPSQRSRG